jgi:hypothetical protein
MTRQEIEQKMDELARKYVETHEPEIRKRFTDWAASLRRWRRSDGLALLSFLKNEA